MATVNDLMKRSLKRLIVAGDESEIEAIESEDYMTVLNAVADEFESDPQVYLTGDGSFTAATNTVSGTAFTKVTNVADVLTSADGIFLALADVMAARLADDYGVAITPKLDQQERRGRNKILRLCTVRKGSFYPGTLPFGSGNEDDGSNYGSGHFYSGTEN